MTTKPTGLVLPAVMTGVALVILMLLGFWQLQRKHEKEQFLAGLQQSIGASPVPLKKGETPPELTRLRVTGQYLAARSVPVRVTLAAPKTSRELGGLGFFWMTPLALDGGGTVFVNRGFVPAGPDGRAPAIETPSGPQTIVGLVRLPENQGPFAPADVPARGDYFNRDPAKLAAAIGLVDITTAFFIDAERGPDATVAPLGLDAKALMARIPNKHLEYALTWFAFAITLMIIFGVFARNRLRENRVVP
jgi:surfeit locus 1 family protein